MTYYTSPRPNRALGLGFALVALIVAGIGAMVLYGALVKPEPAPAYPPVVCEPVMPEDLDR